jgi:hypothetical protein
MADDNSLGGGRVECSHVECQYIDMLESRDDIVTKLDLHIGERRMAKKSIANTNDNNDAAADNKRSPDGIDDDYNPIDDTKDPSPTTTTGGGDRQRKKPPKRTTQTVEVVVVYSRSGPFACLQYIPLRAGGRGRISRLCSNCQKLQTKLRSLYKSNDTSRYTRRMAGQKEKENRRRERQQAKIERERARIAADVRRREAASAAVLLSTSIRPTNELSVNERTQLRNESSSVANWIQQHTSLGLTIDELTSPGSRAAIAAAAAAARAARPRRPRGRPRKDASSTTTTTDNDDGDSTGYESDVEVALSDDEDEGPSHLL